MYRDMDAKEVGWGSPAQDPLYDPKLRAAVCDVSSPCITRTTIILNGFPNTTLHLQNQLQG